MSTILLVKVDPEIAVLFRQHTAPGDRLKAVEQAADGLAWLKQADPVVDVLVLGADLADPVRAAQEAYALYEDVAVLLLAHPRQEEQLQQAIQFAPFLGSSIVCQSTADREALVETYETTLAQVRRHQQYRALLQAAQHKMAGFAAKPGSTRLYLDALLNHAPLGVVVVGEAQRILAWNRRAEVIFGLSEREAIGMSLLALFPDALQERLRSHVTQAADRGRPVRPETFERPLAGGAVQYLDVTAATVSGHAGPPGTMVIFQDVTGRIRAEAEARQLSQQAAVAAALARRADELRRLNEALEQRNRELQEFTYVASHDLQEPLRKIRAFSDLLRTEYDDAVDAEGRHYLERIEDAAGRMSRLLSDLLAYSRVTTKTRPFQRVDLNEVIANVCGDLGVLASDVGGRIEVETLPTIEADPTQMYQLLQNLIGNALKFRAPDVAPHVRIRGAVEVSDALADLGRRPVCRLEVADNGIGFDEKYLDRIFAPFQRLHSRAQYEGTGMGLAICRRIVERHRGAITARSAPGRGSTFIVLLPARQEVH